MTDDTGALQRKNVQVPLKVYDEIRKKKADKEKRLARQGRAREVTMGEVVADQFGVEI